MEAASGASGAMPGRLLESRACRLILLKRIRLRREGSLAAALTQSMALAVMGTAGAYPSWVLVEDQQAQIVLGAAWAITRVDPAPGSPLLGPAGGPLMLAIALCCFVSVLTGSLALTLDFLGRRPCRLLPPLLHGLTAFLIACAAALGSGLLALVRERVRSEPRLGGFYTTPGQSLFLAYLACILASTATGLSCTAPARVEPARSPWTLRREMRDRPGLLPNLAAASSRESLGDFDTSQAQDRFLGAESISSGYSSRVRWRDQQSECLAEDRLLRKRQPEEDPDAGPPPKPAPPARKSILERFWESASWPLLENWGRFFQLPGREPAQPNRAGSSRPAKEQEAETGQETGAPLRPDA